MSFNATLTAIAVASIGSALDLQDALSALNKKYSTTLTDGTGDGQANQIFSDQRTLGASASESLDLAGTLVNPLGATINFSKIKAMIFKAADSNVNDVVIGGAATNGFFAMFGAAAHTIKLKPRGVFMLTAPDANGLTVTPNTGDLLQVANGGAGSNVTYDVILIGA